MEQRRRLLLLTHNYPRWEGDYAGVFLKELVDDFRQDDIEVTVLAPHAKGIPKKEESDNLKVFRFRYAHEKAETLAYSGNMHKQVFRPAGFLKFCGLLIVFFSRALILSIREKPDLISAQWLIPSGLIGGVVSLLTRKRLYLTSHGTDIILLQKSRLLRILARAIYRRCSKAFVVSGYLRELVLNQDIITPAKLIVCPMPARSNIFGKQRVVKHDPLLILVVARLTPQKQLDILLKALTLLKRDGTEFKTFIYGEGELEIKLKELTKSLDLENEISFFRPVSQLELAKIYAAARVTVLPSIDEGFGMTLVEAQLSGSAVVGARSGGILDIIENEVNGLLFDPGNADQLFTCLKAILTDDNLYRHLIVNGRKSAEAKFSSTAIAYRYKTEFGLTA